MIKRINTSLKENIKQIETLFGKEKTFDLIIHPFQIGVTKAALIFLDGFIKDEMLFVLRSLQNASREDLLPNRLQCIQDSYLPYYEVERLANFNEAIDWVLAGSQLLLVEGEREGLIIDAREWLGRTPQEPSIEKSSRGASDGFVETLLFNLTLIRRRIRDPKLRAEHFQVGSRSKNDLALVYIEDIADNEMVDSIRERIQDIETDGLPLADKSIESFLSGARYNIFPKARYTERPDTTAAHLLEGHLAVIVDNSPSLLLLPAPLLSHIQSMEDYRQGAFNGSYMKLLRLFSLFLSTILAPLWLLIVYYQDLLPPFLNFIGPKEASTIPLFIQFALASIGIDMIRMASIHTPEALATSLGIIGALILGEFAVDVGLFSPEVIFYMAVAAIASFTIVGKEMAVSLRVVRLFIILFTGIGKGIGFIIALSLLFYLLWSNKSFGVPYLWPMIPFNYQALRAFLLAEPVLSLSPFRPQFWNAKDDTRLPDKE